MLSTSVVVLAAAVILGTVYQIAEGRSIKEIAEPFAPNFTTKDGFLTSSYIAFYRIVSFGTGTLISRFIFITKRNEAIPGSRGDSTPYDYVQTGSDHLCISWLGHPILSFYSNGPSMIWFIIAGILLTIVIVAFLLAMSVSLNVQIFLSAYRISYLKVSVCGNGWIHAISRSTL